MTRLATACAAIAIAFTLLGPSPALASDEPCALTPPAAPAVAPEDAAFRGIADRYLDSVARFDPVAATGLGDHRFDDKLPDISAAGRAAWNAEARAILAEMGKLDRAKLSRDNQVDYALLDNDLRYGLWRDANLKEWEWDPQGYLGYASSALYGLAARDFAPWPERLRSATARMEGLPALLAEGRAGLVPVKVPQIHAKTVSQRNKGIMDIVDGMLAPHLDTLPEADQARFRAARDRLAAAVEENQHWIDTVLVPLANGDFRLGPKLYDRKMAFALQSSMTRGELKAAAVKARAETRAQMYAIARKVLAGKAGAPPLPGHPTAAQQQAGIEAALALTYAQRPARDGLMDAAKAALVQATDFVREKNLVWLPDSPVQVIEMPRSQWGYAVAYDDAPGPLEKSLPNFFAVAPIPPEWTDAQATSFLSEYNDYMVQDLAIHEAMPGHYLQLAHANKSPDTLRAVLGSGPFIEGWAVYAEGMMMDQGYMDSDPQRRNLFALTVLKMRLRSITNTLLDIGIQTEGMTRDQAMELMEKGAFQQEREAAGKWVRASLSSVQLLSYFTGFEEHRALREEAMKRLGASFDLKAYNDEVLAHGSPPVKYVRELMFGLPVG
ncbi:MAG: DUF885 domain-containing protein [Sphingomonadales bacterium]|nr:DUF885 domain-containing protein [Sphingomonadales bacterium]MDE2568267.1 DUF885 domain-containing protein [Sphingomonadales bacterium]